MACGIFVGLPSLRVKGLYLAIATIAAGVLAHFIFAHWASVTGGSAGLTIKPANVLGIDLDDSFRFYWLVMPITALLLIGAANLFRTRIGRAFIAIRDRDISAEVLGIRLLPYKLLSFAISSFYAGVCGVLYTYYFGIANYEAFQIGVSIDYLAMIIIGGLGSVLGSIFGAIFVTMLPIAIRLVMEPLAGMFFSSGELSSIVASTRLVLFGCLIIFFLVVEPEGLNRLWRNIRNYFRVWPFSY